MNRNWLLSFALFLALTVATFLSVHFQSPRLKLRKQIELVDEQVLEQEILLKKQEWAATEMARYEQARGSRPVRSEEVEEQPVPQTESNLRGSSSDNTKDKKTSAKPF
jgi:hypothetical protein